jgi:hypothetical protein
MDIHPIADSLDLMTADELHALLDEVAALRAHVLAGALKRLEPLRGSYVNGSYTPSVMLNKGPYVLDAVRLLDDIMQRMGAHQRKKMPRLRALGLAGSK